MPRSRSQSTSKPGGVICSCWRMRTGFTSCPSPARAPASVLLDADSLHRTGFDGFERLLAQRRVDIPLPAQHVVVAEVEDLGCDEFALAVALAQVHIHVEADYPGTPLAPLRHHSLSLLLGNGERHVQRVSRNLGLLARPRQVAFQLLLCVE